MAGKSDNLLIEYMRRFDGRQARFEDTLRDMSARLSSIESYLATMHGDMARHGGEIETIKARLDRIERRLELHEPGD
jgi:hypothetical protein